MDYLYGIRIICGKKIRLVEKNCELCGEMWEKSYMINRKCPNCRIDEVIRKLKLKGIDIYP